MWLGNFHRIYSKINLKPFIIILISNDILISIFLKNEFLVLKLREMPWYLLSKKSQLAYAHLLNRLQNGIVFRMGPFGELNFETLSKVLWTWCYCLLSNVRIIVNWSFLRWLGDCIPISWCYLECNRNNDHVGQRRTSIILPEACCEEWFAIFRSLFLCE